VVAAIGSGGRVSRNARGRAVLRGARSGDSAHCRYARDERQPVGGRWFRFRFPSKAATRGNYLTASRDGSRGGFPRPVSTLFADGALYELVAADDAQPRTALSASKIAACHFPGRSSKVRASSSAS
jgi:hypothetical protein